MENAPFSANAHLRIFVWTDILAALLQGIGLGLTFTGAVPAGTWGIILPPTAPAGQSVLFAGLFLQSLGLAGALACLTITYIKAGKADRKYGYTTFHRDGAGYVPLNPRSKTFLAILPLAATCVLVRCTYRAAAAFAGLLESAIARDETLWLVAEGVLLTEAMVTLAVFHPAIWLDDGKVTAPRRQDVESTAAAGAGREGARTRMSIFSMATSSSRGGAKRFSSTSSLGEMQQQAQMQQTHHRDARDSRAELHEVSQLIFQSHLIAPSDAGSSQPSSSAPNSRRGSAVSSASSSSHPSPYMDQDQHHTGLYDDASPYDRRGNQYSEENSTAVVSPPLRDLSSPEAEGDTDEESIAPEVPRKSSKRISRDINNEIEVPRKSSKRMSRLLSPANTTTAAVVAEPSSAYDEDDDDESDSDTLEVRSVDLPLRKPSRRETADDDGMEEVALTSTYSTSLYSQ